MMLAAGGSGCECRPLANGAFVPQVAFAPISGSFSFRVILCISVLISRPKSVHPGAAQVPGGTRLGILEEGLTPMP